jgi:rhodanese-related sulfurtransferase/polyisoprenoid-binding protein YceI
MEYKTMEYKTIKTDELNSLLEDQSRFVLVDVLPENFFNEAHIPGSINIDGYKNNFTDLAEAQLPDKDQTIVLYDSGPDSEAADYAAIRLIDRGWRDVYVYKGGLEEWTDKGNKVEGTEFPSPERPPDKVFDVDTEKSVINWSGRNLNRINIGTVKIKTGTITVRSGTIVNADISIDMNTMKNVDEEPEDARTLEKHLKSEDFFNIERYPLSRIQIERAKEIGELDSGIFNIECYGTLRIKDVTKDIVLHAQFAYDSVEKELKISSLINLDRTIWNVRYGSSRFFKMLGRHFVDDIITLDVHVKAV